MNPRCFFRGFLVFFLIISTVSLVSGQQVFAPGFSAVDVNGDSLSLDDFSGEVLLLHITGLENPLCIECIEEMTGQLRELEKLASSTSYQILTINLRKNVNSDSGFVIAERDYGVNVSWRWVEDFSPYPITGLYQDYWSVDGAFSNPTLVVIDQNQSIVALYHVYCLGKGKIDGIQSASSLESVLSSVEMGTWGGLKEDGVDESLSFIGIFGLGVLTALSPCSIALLVAMISYVGTLQDENRKEDVKKRFSFQGLWIGVFFTLGMAFVFFFFGLIISSVSVFIEVSTLFYLISGVILVVLGVNVFKPLKDLIRRNPDGDAKVRMVETGKNVFLNLSKRSMYLGAFFLGVLFSVGWAPCAISLMMPVFILMLSQKIPILLGGLMLFVFGIGHGIPIIPLCAVTGGLRGRLGNKYVKAGRWMQWVFGLLIIIIGCIMMVRYWGVNLW